MREQASSTGNTWTRQVRRQGSGEHSHPPSQIPELEVPGVTCRCTVPFSLFADPERILRRLYVFVEEPCKSTNTTSEPCSPVFRRLSQDPSEHSNLEYHINNLNLYLYVFGLFIIFCNKSYPTGL